MPLFHGKSKKDFTRNLKTEMHEGKPQKQALAIAYSLKRRGAKKAQGGMCAHGGMTDCPHCTYQADSTSENDPEKMAHMAHGGMHDPAKPWHGEEDKGMSVSGVSARAGKYLPHEMDEAKRMHKEKLEEMRSDKGDRRNMAEGGDIMPHAEDEYDEADYNKKHPMHHDEAAMHEDERKLNQHGEIEEGPHGPRMADGGQITDNYSDEEDGDGTDMVGRIMAQRQRMYSKGGKVANQDEVEAGFSPNEFDDLHLRDDLESKYTGDNSGDELSSEGEEERRHDIVSRIMRSRKLRDRNPRPA